MAVSLISWSPLLIGSDDVAFPRINALSYWIIPPVGVLLLSTPLMGGGRHRLDRLSAAERDQRLRSTTLSFGLPDLRAFLHPGGPELHRDHRDAAGTGDDLVRVPIFVWSILAAAPISLTATQFVAFGLLTIILDRVAGMSFYNAAEGGDALLYEHIFWFYSHPAVYIMIPPAFGIVLEVITHFSRKPLFGY